MARTIVRWEAAGFLFIVLVGSALHFAFAWSGYWTPLAVVAAVNESVWEHLKLAFWPAAAWSLIEMRVFALRPRVFWAAKGLALLVAPVTIVVVFYGYTAVLGHNVLWLDIATFAFAVLLGQVASARLLLRSHRDAALRPFGLTLLAAQLVAYSTLTYVPPRLALFEETRSGIYGIPERGPAGERAPDGHGSMTN